MLLLKLNELGLGTLSDAYGSGEPYDEAANYVCPTSDGGYLLCDYRQSDTSPKDAYVVKVDDTGGFEWDFQLGSDYHDEARCCIETFDGGYAVSSSWHLDGNWKTALIKFNAEGDTMWTAFWGDPAYSHTPYGLAQTSDNGYAVAGLRYGTGPEAFLVKFAAEPAFDPYTFQSSDLNVPVNDGATASDTITVDVSEKSLAGRSVVGVRVMVDTLEHPAVEELSLTLTREGASVTLVAEGDAGGANFYHTAFADAATSSLAAAQAPYTGMFRPATQLGDFNSLDPNGEWILSIIDGTSGNDGVLRAWGITLLTDMSLDVEPDDHLRLPDRHFLSQNYPNPFNPTTTIEFDLP